MKDFLSCCINHVLTLFNGEGRGDAGKAGDSGGKEDNELGSMKNSDKNKYILN